MLVSPSPPGPGLSAGRYLGACRKDSAYLHLCGNETIGGVEFTEWPDPASLEARTKTSIPSAIDETSRYGASG